MAQVYPRQRTLQLAPHMGIKPVIGAGILAGQRKLARRGIFGTAKSPPRKIIDTLAVLQKEHMFALISSPVTD